MSIKTKIFTNAMKIIKNDKKNVFYLLYYAMIEAVLILSIPLASSFIINSVLAHAKISLYVLGLVVIITFILMIFLKVLQEYIVENFEQKIFVNAGIEIMELASELRNNTSQTKTSMDKYMNYFFDVISIQKVFPMILLDGAGLFMKVIVSLLLLFIFNPILFISGLVIAIIYIYLLVYFGKGSMDSAIKRSDAKHQSIYYLQSILESDKPKEEIFEAYDGYLNEFVKTRKSTFKIIIRLLTLTFFMEGVILSGFLIVGGSLVISGALPIGEFVAAEIIVVSIVYALKIFVKQIDYMYDMVEGFYKVDKLSATLGEKSHA
ncbi:MAG: ABC transporter ATP-binding protein [Sulfurovum sp.]|nr:ABC transporter ATP-binding protein [Sulfurovum sp.]NNJ45389.1 ABC transporter ATP-binding protein [Sulfurovum sp.]